MVDLSILIASLHKRGHMREALLYQLAYQPEHLLKRTQIIVDIDGGEATIGAKRNRLLDASVGRYIVFIDDDDEVTESYLTRIFEGIDRDVDHIGVGMLYAPPNQHAARVLCSMNHGWETRKDGVYLRPPQHVCAVKRELAQAVRFPEISYREDMEYALALKPLVKTEYVIDEPIYHYIFIEEKA